jgi:hypothetical protein
MSLLENKRYTIDLNNSMNTNSYIVSDNSIDERIEYYLKSEVSNQSNTESITQSFSIRNSV